MSNHDPTVLIISALGALIPLVLLGGSSLATWRRLARTHPDSPFVAERTFRSVSGYVGGTYGPVFQCLRVELGSVGLRISSWPILQRLFPPFTIPWSEITACDQARHYFSPLGACLQIAHWPQPIILWTHRWRDENLPQLIQTFWQKHTTALRPKDVGIAIPNSNPDSERIRNWFKVRAVKGPDGVFVVTVDGFPRVTSSSHSSDDALALTALALERLESEGAAVPERTIYTWDEYVDYALRPMGKLPFAELPINQRFLRKGFPTMWDKMTETDANPLDREWKTCFIPPDEIVWHYVYELSDEWAASEWQERRLWTGNPDFHF